MFHDNGDNDGDTGDKYSTTAINSQIIQVKIKQLSATFPPNASVIIFHEKKI